MSNTGFGFSVPQADVPKDEYSTLPDGKYPLQLIEAERAASKKDARNWMIVAKYRVLSGPFADKVHIERYNVGHANEDAKKIALQSLVKLSEAVGYTGPLSGMDPYFGKQFCATIKNKPQKDDPEKFNCQISKYENISAYSALPAAPTVVAGSFAPASALPPVPTATTAQAPAPAFIPPAASPGPWPVAAAA